MRVRLVTWNVHGCVGADGDFDPQRTARVIRSLAPDILALQEVDSRHRRHGGLDAFTYFRKAVGGHAVDGKSITTADGHYGQMLISRWPLRNPQIHDISVQGREPRRAVEAMVDLPSGPLRVIATHLGLNAAERRAQFRSLTEISKREPEMRRILMGDFNDWRRRGQGHRLLSPLFDACASPRTFPAALPVLPLDRIWLRADHVAFRSWAERTIRRASDHLPLAADLALR